MCLVALFFRMVEDAPLIVGANREEAYARGGEPPRLHDGPVKFVAGVDPTAGGAWLGMNAHGLVVAVANRMKTQPPAQPRSRGLLVRDLLGCRSATEAAQRAGQELGSNRYQGCNLVCTDGRNAIVIHAGDWLRVRPLPSGLHVLTANDVNDLSDRRIAHSLWWLSEQHYAIADDCVAALKRLCAQTGEPGPPICLRGDTGGTVSSSILVVRRPASRGKYLHAQGPPDRTAYEDYSSLLKALNE